MGSSLTIEFIDGNRSTLATYELKVNDLIPDDELALYPATYSIEKEGMEHVTGNSEWYVNSTPFDN